MHLCFCKIVSYCYEIDFNAEKNVNEIVFTFKAWASTFSFLNLTVIDRQNMYY